MLRKCASLRMCTFSRERKRSFILLPGVDGAWERRRSVRCRDMAVLVDCLFRGDMNERVFIVTQ